MKNIILILFLVSLILVSGCAAKINNSQAAQASEKKYHTHSEFMVYIDGKQIDFGATMYQLRAKSVHVEDGIGERIHVHKEGITMGDFLQTLNINFNSTCILSAMEGTYCTNKNKKLVFYVNDEKNTDYENYVINEGDKILLSYGTDNIKEQLESLKKVDDKNDSSTMISPQDSVQLYYQSLNNKDYAAMYSLISSGFKEIDPIAADFKTFENYMDKFFDTSKGLEVVSVKETYNNGKKAAVEYIINIISSKGKQEFKSTFSLKKQSDGWKLIHPYGENIDTS